MWNRKCLPFRSTWFRPGVVCLSWWDVMWCPLRFPSKRMLDAYWLLFVLWGGFMFYLCYLYLFTHTGVQHDFHITWCSCRLTVTRRVSHVEQELLSLPEHPSSPPVFSGVRVALSLVFCVMFCGCCLSLRSFSFGYCVVCPSSIYGFWLSFWYLSLFLQSMY